MFESDDFDQVLSQFEFPDVPMVVKKPNENSTIPVCASLIESGPEREAYPKSNEIITRFSSNALAERKLINESKQSSNISKQTANSYKNTSENELPIISAQASERTDKEFEHKNSVIVESFVSPKHTKRKIINSYFNHQSKRKFPGPAGLLTGALEEPKDESICQIELLSQDIDCNQHLQKDLFLSPLWARLQSDTQSWKLPDIDSIKSIKQQALSGNLRQQKAQTVTAFVEAVDRSATDPLIILRDSTGSIKCTLHRDAWTTFSPYIVSEYCALVLQKPTVLTTGAAFKKHYLNITLNNIRAIYSSAVLSQDEGRSLPDGYSVLYQEQFTVIKSEKSLDTLGSLSEQSNGAEDLFQDLDSIFSDDVF